MLLTFPGRSIGTAGVSVGSGSSVGIGVSVGSGPSVGIGVSTGSTVGIGVFIGSEDDALVAAGVSVGSTDGSSMSAEALTGSVDGSSVTASDLVDPASGSSMAAYVAADSVEACFVNTTRCAVFPTDAAVDTVHCDFLLSAACPVTPSLHTSVAHRSIHSALFHLILFIVAFLSSYAVFSFLIAAQIIL